MPELVKVTTEMLKNWKPSAKQTRGGSRLYSIKVFKEGVEFEKAGDLDNAAIRYEKARSYCKLKDIPYPPFAITQTALMQNAKDDKPFVRAYPEKSFAPKILKPLNGLSPAKALKAEQRYKGKQAWVKVLLRRGDIEGAMVYCTNHSLPWEGPPVVPLSSGQVPVPEVSLSALSPQCDTAAKSEGQIKPVPDQSSSVGDKFPVSPPAMVTGAAPKSNLGDSPTLEPVSDWAGEVTQGSIVGTSKGAPVALAQSANSSAVPAHGAARDVQTGSAYKPDETGGTAVKPSVGDSHVAQGDPVKPRLMGHETASPAVRKAKVWNFPMNKRLVNVKFLDGEQEVAAMWNNRSNYRMNEPVQVKLERGSGSSAIYEEVRNRV